MRQPIIAANWKMHKTVSEAREYVWTFHPLIAGLAAVEVVLAPPFTALDAVAQELQRSEIELAAQDMWHEPEGAYTGEISPLMLEDSGCKYVIIGHSERRRYFKESNELINRKLKAALAHSLTPILCVGEGWEERRAGKTEAVLEEEIRLGLAGLNGEAVAAMVIAYEPIWAIGTGETASSQDANEGAKFIRELVGKLCDGATAEAIRIQYGGSVKPENITALMDEKDLDGALVGGASLDPQKFAQIVKGAVARAD